MGRTGEDRAKWAKRALLVYLFQNVGSDHCVQIRLHVVTDEVDVLVIACFQDIEEAHNVLMAIELLESIFLLSERLSAIWQIL